MVLLKKAESIWGGRALVFAAPFILLLIGAIFLTANELIQVDNTVILALAGGIIWTWRDAFPIFMREYKRAGMVWLSLGVISLVVTTVANVGISWVFRVYHEPEMAVTILTNSYWTACLRFGYAFGLGCLYVVPMAVDDEVPPHGWVSLFVIVALSGLSAIAGILWGRN